MSSDRVFREAAETNGKAHCNADVKQAGAYDPLNEGFAGLPGPDPAGHFRDLEQRYGWPTPPPSDGERKFREGKIEGLDEAVIPDKMTPMEAYGFRHVESLRDRVTEHHRKEAGPDGDNATSNPVDTLAIALAELADSMDGIKGAVESLIFKGQMDYGASQEDVDAAINDADYMKQAVLELCDRLRKFRRW